MNNMQSAITSWVSKGENIPNRCPFASRTRNGLKWKMSFLSYSETSGWKVVELNLFQRIFRKLGAFRNTHSQFIKEKLLTANPDNLSCTDEKAKRVFQQVFDKFLKSPIDVFKTDAVLKRTSQDVVNKIYESFEALDSVLRENGINYSLAWGSQLGATRHEGLIPWDDDGDIAILEEDEQSFLNLKEEFRARGYEIVQYEFGYKIQNRNYEIVPNLAAKDGICRDYQGIPFRFPNIDIFLMKKREGLDPHAYYPANDASYKTWPTLFYKEEEWGSIQDVSFGHLTLKGLVGNNAKTHLNRLYFDKKTKEPNWENSAGRWWDHEENRATREQLNLQLLARRPALPRPFFNHQEIAEKHLKEMTKQQLDEDWKLDDFFGHVAVINLDRSPHRLEQVTKELEQVGLNEGQFERFSAVDGLKLDEKIWKRIDSNFNYLFPGSQQLKKQNKGEVGCFFSHYQLLKKVRDQFQEAMKNLEEAKRNNNVSEIEKAEREALKYSNVLILEDDNCFGRVDEDERGTLVTTYADGKTKDVMKARSKTIEKAGRIFRKAMRALPREWDMLYFNAMDFDGAEELAGKKHVKKLRRAVLNNCYAVNARFYDTLINHLSIIECERERIKAIDDRMSLLHKRFKCYCVSPSITMQKGASDIHGNDPFKDAYRQTIS